MYTIYTHIHIYRERVQFDLAPSPTTPTTPASNERCVNHNDTTTVLTSVTVASFSTSMII